MSTLHKVPTSEIICNFAFISQIAFHAFLPVPCDATLIVFGYVHEIIIASPIIRFECIDCWNSSWCWCGCCFFVNECLHFSHWLISFTSIQKWCVNVEHSRMGKNFREIVISHILAHSQCFFDWSHWQRRTMATTSVRSFIFLWHRAPFVHFTYSVVCLKAYKIMKTLITPSK